MQRVRPDVLTRDSATGGVALAPPVGARVAGASAPGPAARAPRSTPPPRRRARWWRTTWRGPATAPLLALDAVSAALVWIGGALALHAVDPLPAAVAALAWPLVVRGCRGHDSRPGWALMEDLRRLLRAMVLLIIGVAGVCHLFAWALSPIPLCLLVTLTAALSMLGRFLMAQRARTTRERVVVMGHHRAVRQTVAALEADHRASGEVVAVCVHRDQSDRDSSDTDPRRVPVIAGFEQVLASVAAHSADAVVVHPCRHLDPAAIQRLGWLLDGTDTDLLVLAGLPEVAPWRETRTRLGTVELRHLRAPELTGSQRLLKATWERSAALVALLLLAPLIGLLALAVRLDSRGPAFYRQDRIGLRGQPFVMWKLRTMSTDADSRRSSLVSDADGLLFKMRADPRVTRVGRVLRCWSLDELPQLLNVVRGDMALVGPRPPLPVEVSRYSGDVRRRLLVRPGVTGLWQVSGRSDLSWEDAVRLDVSYVDNWSLWLDLTILLRTVGAVLGRRGAY